MPKNDLAHDLNGSPSPASICGRMPPEVMRTQFDTDFSACFFYDLPGARITDRENPFVGCDIFCADIFPESARHLFRNEHDFILPAALGADQKQFAVLEIHHSEFEHFPDPHAAPGHKFKHQPVSYVVSQEDNLINNIFFQDTPVPALGVPERLSQNRGIAGIYERGIIRVLDKIEEGFKQGILEMLGRLFLAFCVLGQKRQNLIGRDGINILIFEIGFKPDEKKPIILGRIFSPSSISDNRRSC